MNLLPTFFNVLIFKEADFIIPVELLLDSR